MRRARGATASLGIGLAVVLAIPFLLVVAIVPIFFFSVVFVLGAIAWGATATAWLAVDAVRGRRVVVALPAAEPAAVTASTVPVLIPRAAVIVRVARVSGVCPLAHIWHEGEMFTAGAHMWPKELACPKAQHMIQTEATQMLGRNGQTKTLRCVGPRHLIEFELQNVRPLARVT